MHHKITMQLWFMELWPLANILVPNMCPANGCPSPARPIASDVKRQCPHYQRDPPRAKIIEPQPGGSMRPLHQQLENATVNPLDCANIMTSSLWSRHWPNWSDLELKRFKHILMIKPLLKGVLLSDVAVEAGRKWWELRGKLERLYKMLSHSHLMGKTIPWPPIQLTTCTFIH